MRRGDDNRSHDGTLDEENKREIEENEDLLTTTFIKQAHAIPGSLQIINFVKNKLSYEFSSKHMDAVELIPAQQNANFQTAAMTAEHARE